MKRIVALVLVLLSLFSVAAASTIDLSDMTYDELVALKDKINLAIWNSQEWQEVTVPQGVWMVGKDIPSGHWTIKTVASWACVELCTALDETGKDVDLWVSEFYHSEHVANPKSKYFDPTSDKAETDLVLKDGTYVIVDGGNVIFTPYSGKPSLGFK